MIIKRIGKLKQQKGAVLFTVIAIMTLLIAMASTAYYTARGAHNTVVSNYNYSQLYISAVSVADMISESVINDTAINATTTNNFKPLKDALANLNEQGKSVMAYSPNITDVTKSNEEIIKDLASSGNSIIDGTLDGITIKITLPKGGVSYRNYADGTDDSGNPVRFHYYDYTYIFTTTAFYNGNTITVEDYLTTVKVKKSTGAVGTPGAPGDPGTPGSPSNNNVNFSTFFTATGQDFNADGGYGKANRSVKIVADEITDDAFFENTYTFFNTGRNNNIKGGITSSGSVYLNKYKCDGIDQSDDNDWFIGKDLVLSENGGDLNLGAKNDLYVGRDLVLTCDGNKITAGDIYVEGDLYVIGQVTINGNIHVNGNIYYELSSDSEVVTAAATYNNGQSIKLGGNRVNDGLNIKGGVIDVNGDIVLPSGYPSNETATIKIDDKPYSAAAGKASNCEVIGGGYNSDVREVTITNRVVDDDKDKFVDDPNTVTVKDAIALKTGTDNVYASYTSKQETYDNKVTVDFSQLEVAETEGESKKPVRYEYTFKVDEKDVVLEYDTRTEVAKVKIPYIEDGVLLDINAETLFNNGVFTDNATLEYEIGEGDGSEEGKTMAVVLASNVTDKDGNKAFSWRGENKVDKNNNSGGKWTAVSVMGKGNVTFEMANYSLTEPDKYIPYNPNDYKNIGTVNYIVDQHEIVGTQAQVDYFRVDINNPKDGFKETNDVSGMLQSGTSVPKDEYQNRIMLVSNSRNGDKAIDGDVQNNTFCGYMYAPNAHYYVGEGTNSNMTTVFGGMIVSTYTASKSTYTYAEPKPSLISQMLGSLVGSQVGTTGGTKGTPAVPDKPATPPKEPSDNVVDWLQPDGMYGYNWQYQGTNFLG